MLSAHEHLYAVPYESKLFQRDASERPEFIARFESELRDSGKARWVEKTPRHVLHLGEILAAFPNARIILMMRDGRDVACSIRDRVGDFETGINRWLDHNAAADPYRDRPEVRVLKYEDLVADPERELREICAFLGEPFDPAMLSHHETPFRFYGGFDKMEKFRDDIEALSEKPDSVSGKGHRLYRSWQARQPVFDGRARWRDELSDEEQALFMERAGDALARYGYDEGGGA
jgi:hypothetical protein